MLAKYPCIAPDSLISKIDKSLGSIDDEINANIIQDISDF